MIQPSQGLLFFWSFETFQKIIFLSGLGWLSLIFSKLERIVLYYFPYYFPISNSLFLVEFVQAERALYLMLPPMILFFIQGFEKISKKLRPENVKIFKILLIGITLGKTSIRARDWQNEKSLHISAVRLGSLKSQVNLGSIFGENGKFNTSYFLLREALRRKTTSDIFYNLGLIQQKSIIEYIIRKLFQPRRCRDGLVRLFKNKKCSRNVFSLNCLYLRLIISKIC